MAKLNVGADIRILRRLIGLTMRAGGQYVGGSEALVSRWETARRPMQSARAQEYARQILERAAAQLGVDMKTHAGGAELDAEIAHLAGIVRDRLRRAGRRLDAANRKVASAAALIKSGESRGV